MKRAAMIAVVAVALLVSALALRAPASLVTPRLEHLTSDRLSLVDTRGTLWHGTGTLAAGDQRLPIAWRLHPASLVRGELAVTLAPASPGASTPRGDIVARQSSAHVREFSIELPAAALIAAAIPRPRLDARGVIDLQASDLDWPPRTGAGSISAVWRNAAIGLAGALPVDLGDVTARLTAQDRALRGPLRNTGGEFALDGELTIREDGSGGVNGVVRTRRPDDPRLAALLAIGTPEAGGVRVQWQWPAP